MSTAVDDVRALALVGTTDVSGCTLHRVFLPFAELQRQKACVAEWGYKDDPRLADLAPAFNVFVLPRLSWLPEDQDKAVRWVDTLHRLGGTVVYECDDDLFSPWIVPQQKTSVAPDRTLQQLEAERQARIFALRLCDGVTVTSQRLATVVREYARPEQPVCVVPNALDVRWWRRVQKAAKREISGLTVGWAGGARPDRDVAVLAQAWGILAGRYGPDRVTFVTQGYQADSFAQYVPPERLRRIPWLPLERYPQGLVNIDIGCCPLADAPFNRCKSALKLWEYGATGAAVVASPTIYGPSIAHGVNGYLATTVDEWGDTLSDLIERPARRGMMARELRRFVLSRHRLDREAWRWPAAWRFIREATQRQGQGQRIILPMPARVGAVA